MPIIETIKVISQEFNTFLTKQDIEEILFLLEHDVGLYHLSKINQEEAIQEAILYITPDY